MKPGAGKGKGGEYERQIAGKISLWLSNGERNDLLCRTVSSGAQWTTGKRGHPADLRAQDTPLAFEFCSKYAIECKHWRDIGILLLMRRKGELFTALQKVRDEAFQTSKPGWWLVVRQNHQPDMLFTGSRELVEEDLKPQALFPEYHTLFSGIVHIYYLDEFLDRVNPVRYVLI